MVALSRSRSKNEYDENGRLIGMEVFWRIHCNGCALPVEISTAQSGMRDASAISPPTGKALLMELLSEFSGHWWYEEALACAMSEVFPGSAPKTEGGMRSFRASEYKGMTLVESDWRYVFRLSSVILEWSFEATVDSRIVKEESVEAHLWSAAMQYMILEILDLLDTSEKIEHFIESLCRKASVCSAIG